MGALPVTGQTKIHEKCRSLPLLFFLSSFTFSFSSFPISFWKSHFIFDFCYFWLRGLLRTPLLSFAGFFSFVSLLCFGISGRSFFVSNKNKRKDFVFPPILLPH